MSEEYSGLGRRGERERGGAEGKKKKKRGYPTLEGKGI